MTGAAGLIAVRSLLAEWKASRAALARLERAEHPDLVDRFGRVWAWESHDVYVHDQLAFPPDAILSPRLRLPSATLADSPNYRLCDVCTSEWPR
jgi:hypothetical protein